MTQKLEHYQSALTFVEYSIQQQHNTYFSSAYEAFAKKDLSLGHKTSLKDLSSYKERSWTPQAVMVAVESAFISIRLAPNLCFFPTVFFSLLPPVCFNSSLASMALASFPASAIITL